MALDLPPELQPVLGLLGVEWPQVNEDEINRFADEIRKLASAIDSTQMAADKAVAKLGEVYHGSSADQLTQAWGAISKFSGLVVEACGVIANALSAAALVVELCKGGAIAQLAVTSGGLATAAATAPWTTPAVLAAGKQIVSQVLETAVTELGHALAQPVADLVDTAVKAVTGGDSGKSGSSTGQGFGVDLAQLASCALELRGHADDVDSNGSAFLQIFDGMDLGQPGEIIGKVVIEAAEQIATTVGTEVIKRLLSSLRGTADGMDQVGKNLTENEDAHSQLMSNLLTSPTPTAALSPLQLTGGAKTLDASGTHPTSHTGIDSLHPQVDLAGADGTVDPSPADGTPATVALQQEHPGTGPAMPPGGRLSPQPTPETGPSHSTTGSGTVGARSTAAAPGSATPGAYGQPVPATGTSTGTRPGQGTGTLTRAALTRPPTDEREDEDEQTAAVPDLPTDPPAEDPDSEY
ncbi:hypothetical protein [Kitasatospora sp. McL0602]|uniref:WXG100-like domain-containing protein n=1 Tax=Kitasatospora sp. McL0602 TaxID=3439530 RepID=UPI003F8CC2EF